MNDNRNLKKESSFLNVNRLIYPSGITKSIPYFSTNSNFIIIYIIINLKFNNKIYLNFHYPHLQLPNTNISPYLPHFGKGVNFILILILEYSI